MLTTRYKVFFNRLFEPSAQFLIRLGFTPNVLTLSSVVLTTAVCAWFIRTGMVVPFCLLMGLIGCLDGLDGVVARTSGRVTKFGAYLDAMADRYVESLVALSVAWVTGEWLLISLVLVGALLVSYAKARAAMEVAVSNQEWPDLMERMERDGLFLLGLLVSRLVPWRPLGKDLFWWTLVGLTALIHLTVVQRILRAKRLIAERQG